MGGIGGCPNIGGICIGCTMPRVSGQIHALHGSAAGIVAILKCSYDVWQGDPCAMQVYSIFLKQGASWRRKAAKPNA